MKDSFHFPLHFKANIKVHIQFYIFRGINNRKLIKFLNTEQDFVHDKTKSHDCT